MTCPERVFFLMSQFGRKKKKYRGKTNSTSSSKESEKKEVAKAEDDEEEEDEEEEDGDLSKYKLDVRLISGDANSKEQIFDNMSKLQCNIWEKKKKSSCTG